MDAIKRTIFRVVRSYVESSPGLMQELCVTQEDRELLARSIAERITSAGIVGRLRAGRVQMALSGPEVEEIVLAALHPFSSSYLPKESLYATAVPEVQPGQRKDPATPRPRSGRGSTSRTRWRNARAV